jgi:predicted ATPase
LRPTERHLSVAAKKLIFSHVVGKRPRQARAAWSLLTGEAGIGKSRLTRALQDHLAKEQHRTITYHCSPDRQGSAPNPIHKPAFAAADIQGDENAGTKLDKLEAMLSIFEQ